MLSAFLPSSPLVPSPFPLQRAGKKISAPPLSTNPPRRARPTALLSTPFPHDLFAFPPVAFTQSTAVNDFRPELLGSLMWTTGLYFGFSERRRWGSVLLASLTQLLSSAMPAGVADAVATATHTLPFLAVGFGVDAVLRHANGGSAVWAVAAGLSVALYGGIYELGRTSAGGKAVSEEDRVQYGLFSDFASRKLSSKGMCHLVDIRAAVKKDPQARRLGRLPDETIRRFVRNTFPKAKRSPNGFYRGVSVREVPLKRQTEEGDW